MFVRTARRSVATALMTALWTGAIVACGGRDSAGANGGVVVTHADAPRVDAQGDSGQPTPNQPTTRPVVGDSGAVVGASGALQTVACAGNPVTVSGSDNVLTLTGTCPLVTVTGSRNALRINLLGTLRVSGQENEVRYVSGTGGSAPTITNAGANNRIVSGG